LFSFHSYRERWVTHSQILFHSIFSPLSRCSCCVLKVECGLDMPFRPRLVLRNRYLWCPGLGSEVSVQGVLLRNTKTAPENQIYLHIRGKVSSTGSNRGQGKTLTCESQHPQRESRFAGKTGQY